jgi:hypothetical protein
MTTVGELQEMIADLDDHREIRISETGPDSYGTAVEMIKDGGSVVLIWGRAD